MTLAELTRAIDSKKRIQKHQAQEKACNDYILADLIGKSIARIYSSSAKMPEIAEAYPALFNTEYIEEQKTIKQDELSALRFKQYANFHNKKFNQGVANE